MIGPNAISLSAINPNLASPNPASSNPVGSNTVGIEPIMSSGQGSATSSASHINPAVFVPAHFKGPFMIA